jgi:feruloyl-CoA synthase
MGLPAAGLELKLVPFEGKLEARVRGPNITPGYWRQPEYTRNAFDDEGFYKLGDTFKFADPDHPEQGLLFDGRIAEDFKLSSGTWVNVGPLRAQFIDAFKPYVRDVVFAGLDRDYIAALVFPDVEACRKILHRAPDTPADQIVQHYDVQQHFTSLLAKMAAAATGSSNRVQRIMLMTEPPSMDKGEMTDKGSINQRAVLKNRADLVNELYADEISSRVIRL